MGNVDALRCGVVIKAMLSVKFGLWCFVNAQCSMVENRVIKLAC